MAPETDPTQVGSDTAGVDQEKMAHETDPTQGGIDTAGALEDEEKKSGKLIHVTIYNQGSKKIELTKGDRIAQLILERNETPEVEEVSDVQDTERGENGFGSTGNAEREYGKACFTWNNEESDDILDLVGGVGNAVVRDHAEVIYVLQVVDNKCTTNMTAYTDEAAEYIHVLITIGKCPVLVHECTKEDHREEIGKAANVIEKELTDLFSELENKRNYKEIEGRQWQLTCQRSEKRKALQR